MQNKTVLIIDDDVNLCQTIQMLCSTEGATVHFATDGRKGLQKFYEVQPDVVLLDIRMPDVDGWETCHHIRLISEVPVIMLTTLDQDREIVRGFEGGADDYVTKPFSNAVLLARINAQLRRRSQPTPEPEAQPVDGYADEYLQIDLDNHQVTVQGEAVKLTITEFELLTYLVNHPGKLLKYESILGNVWGVSGLRNKDYVHIYLSHLRKKLEADPKNPRYLVTEYGMGVRFMPQNVVV